MNLIDVLILGFILLGALHGYQRGLLTSVINFLSSVVAFVVAVWLYVPALKWAEQYIPLQKWLEPIIYKALLPSLQSGADTLQEQLLANLLQALPAGLRSFFSTANMPSVPLTETIEQVSHNLAGMLTEHILNLIAFGVVFYAVALGIHLVFGILIRPLVSWGRPLNRGGGLLFGGLTSLIGLSVFAGLFSPLLHLGVGGSVSTLIQNSYIYPYLIDIFNGLDQLFSAQLRQNLLEPLSLDKGNWF